MAIFATLCGYNCGMDLTLGSQRIEVGIRELKNQLSRYVEYVRSGKEVIVTDHGRPVARLMPLTAGDDLLQQLIESGAVRPASRPKDPTPKSRLKAKGLMSELVSRDRG